jgi:hypothetical protein
LPRIQAGATRFYKAAIIEMRPVRGPTTKLCMRFVKTGSRRTTGRFLDSGNSFPASSARLGQRRDSLPGRGQ